MAKRRKLQDIFDDLSAARDNPNTQESIAEFKRTLKLADPHAVARVAEIAREFQLGELLDDIESAFDRFLGLPGDKDKNCTAKTALAQTYYQLDGNDYDLYLRGIRIIQLEPMWGRPEDSAGALRGICAIGLVFSRYASAIDEVVELLLDPIAIARKGAVQALATAAESVASPLLRYKALLGDEDLDVTSACFTSLIEFDADSGIPFVTRFLELEDEPALQEMAALCLGASRQGQAFDALRSWLDSSLPASLEQTGMLSIATLGRPEAIEFLVESVKDAGTSSAIRAVKALEFYLSDAAILSRVREAVEERGDLELPAELAALL